MTDTALYTESKQTVLAYNNKRSWFRLQCYDHPGYIDRREDAYDGADKVKVWCKACFKQRVAAEQAEDARSGRPARETKDIEVALWALPRETPNNYRWMQSAPYAMGAHLSHCPLLNPDDRARAQREHDMINKSPRRNRRSQPEHLTHFQPPPPPPQFAFPAPIPGSSSMPPPLGNPFTGSPFTSRQSPASTSLPPLSLPVTPQFPSAHGSPTGSPYTYYSPGGFPLGFQTSPHAGPSQTASPSPSLTHMRSENPATNGSPRPAKRARLGPGRSVSGRGTPGQAVPSDVFYAPWPPERQETYDSRIMRLTAAQGWPLSWTENPEWISFCDDFIPQAKNPTRKVITSRLLPAEVKSWRDKAQAACTADPKQPDHVDKLATITCDGFTPRNQHHIVAFMITVTGQVYAVKVYDTSDEPKTADNLLRMMKEVLAMVEKDWGVTVIAVTSDCSGESRAARARLVRERKELVGPDCYAHQVDLVVHDYFKTKTDIFIWTKLADEVIRWLRSRGYLLALLRDAQMGIAKYQGKPLSVIRGVLTRWTSHYIAYHRVLELQPALYALAVDPRLYLSGTEESHEKTREMLKITSNPLFWHGLARVKRQLEPLAVAAHSMQTNDCRLDQVVLTFARLYRFFDAEKEPEDAPLRDAVLKSLEKRWAKADQDVFVAATICNPFSMAGPFVLDENYFSYSAVGRLMKRLWTRFFPDEDPHTLYNDTKAYLRGTEGFASMKETMESIRAATPVDPRTGITPEPNPIEVWKDMCISHRTSEMRPLHRLAIHLLSICPTAANCERLFSALGIIMSPLRARLTIAHLIDLAELRLHLKTEHLRQGVKTRLKRFFGEHIEVPQVPPELANVARQPGPVPQPAVDAASAHALAARVSASRSPLESVVSRLGQRSAEDEADDFEDSEFPSEIKISLEQLFDFSREYWKVRPDLSTTASLNEELGVWDLLDMDADGEADNADTSRVGSAESDDVLSAIFGV